MGQNRKPALQRPVGSCLFQVGHQVSQCAVVDPPSVLRCGNGKANGQVGLSDTRRAKQHHVLLPLEEPEFCQAHDLLALDGWLEGEVELLEGLHHRQPGTPHGRLEPAVVAKGNLGSEQLLYGLARGDLAAVSLSKNGVRRLKCARKLQVSEHATDTVSAGADLSFHAPLPTSRS